MKKIITLFTLLLFITPAVSLAGEDFYKGVFLSNGTPALLRLADSALVEIGKDWRKWSDMLFTPELSLPEDIPNLFIKSHLITPSYYTGISHIEFR